jgi:hypothetical protein
MCERGQGAREGLCVSDGRTRKDYEARGEFVVRTERPKGVKWIREDVLPRIRGRWRQGEEILILDMKKQGPDQEMG